MDNNFDLTAALEYIDPASLDYQEWINVGMALKAEGYSVTVWDNWSRNDSRYHPGECARKWESFNGAPNPVTGATIVKMAKDNGWLCYDSHELDWDAEIGRENTDDLVVVNKNWIEGKEIAEPAVWNPVQQIITYLETLFDVNENVGYVVSSFEEKGKYKPTSKGNTDRTAGQLIEALSKCGGDIGSVLGDYNPAAGAWVRINPLDGNGVKNSNVTDFRYVLVESDSVELERQNAIIRELELPVAALVYSGGKSVHAIVKVEAASYEEYRKRVDYLFNVCKKNGLEVDTNCRNPSRLSRLPGVQRGDKKQFIIDTNIGKGSWNEWKDWIESVNDDLPDPENVSDIWDNMPELSPPLIDGVLRQGHKMLLAGPSKAGKSYALIELCCAVAEGKEWFGFKCTQGRIMYVNLELDRASCMHRFKDVYTALGYAPEHLSNIDIWNLRGKTVPMDKLAPKLIRRASKKNYIAIVIDPIYKVITGDENSADQMAHFCNQFDKVCTELGCAVIYCHHHSKGNQGGKRSMDRASGSGVFARDPDALLDLIELALTEKLIDEEKNKAVCKSLAAYLDAHGRSESYSQDDACSRKQMREIAQRVLDGDSYQQAIRAANEAEKRVDSRTAWRIEGTLREFPKFPPLNLWFDYPVHRADLTGVLKDAKADIDAPYINNFKNKRPPEEVKEERMESLETAFSACDMDGGKVPISELAEYLGKSEKTVRRYLKDHKDFWVEDGMCGKKV